MAGAAAEVEGEAARGGVVEQMEPEETEPEEGDEGGDGDGEAATATATSRTRPMSTPMPQQKLPRPELHNPPTSRNYQISSRGQSSNLRAKTAKLRSALSVQIPSATTLSHRVITSPATYAR